MRPPERGALAGFRGLGLFWAAVLGAAGLGIAILEMLGPPARPVARAHTNPVAASVGEAAAAPAQVAAAAVPVSETRLRPAPGSRPGPIAVPDPALLEPAPDVPGRFLPRIGADGRRPDTAYARAFDAADPRPRVGLVLAGIGLNGADSAEAIRTLPGEITLAVSPYAAGPDPLLDQARAAGHELLDSIPMEPQGYPLNDPGDHGLLTGLAPDQNRYRLDWTLSRFAGYVGATGALGDLRGERFAASPEQMTIMLQALAGRGLLYVDPRPGAPVPLARGRAIDLVIDDPPMQADIDAKLAALEQIAHDKGSALGLAGAVRPVTTARLAAWANGLAARGLAIAPVSALAAAPETRDAER